MDWPNKGQLFLLLLLFLATVTVIYVSICYGLKRLFFKNNTNFFRFAIGGMVLIWVATIAISIRYPMGYQRIGAWDASEKYVLVTAWERYWWSSSDRIIRYRYQKSDGRLEVWLGNEFLGQREGYAYTQVTGEIVRRMAESVAPSHLYYGKVKGHYGEQPLAK